MIKDIVLEDLEMYLSLVNDLVDDVIVDSQVAREMYLSNCSREDYFMIGYYENNVLLGSATGMLLPDFTGDLSPIMIVENVIVSAYNRRKGVGTMLMNYFEDLAIEKRCRAISFFSSVKRVGAHKFYEKIGYTKDVVQGYKKYLK